LADRCSDAELRKRELAALELLATGAGSAFTAQTIAAQFGVSLRQARRYVQAASLDLVADANPAELDRQAMLSLYRLDLIAGRAMDVGDETLAIKATRAHSVALAQFRRAITAPAVRFRLRDQRAPPDLPF
jgi:predicted DNA-binding transcriptional regulator YafY